MQMIRRDVLSRQAGLVEKLLTDLRAFLLAAAHCQKPDQQALNTLLTPLQADIEAVSRLKEANRKDREWFTHLSTVAEGAPCVGWVTVVRKRLHHLPIAG